MISLIVAIDKQRTMGKDNQLPWYLPADLVYFKQVTMGKPIVMGRKTFESIGRVLPGRENIIITRNKAYPSKDCTVVHSLDEVIKRFQYAQTEVFIIGGAEIFEDAIDIADKIYLTYIDDVFDGDTFFPLISEQNWELTSKVKGQKDESNPFEYYFMVYEKR